MGEVRIPEVGSIVAGKFRVTAAINHSLAGALFRVTDIATHREHGLFAAHSRRWKPGQHRMSHPNIVRFTTTGVDPQFGPFAIMDAITTTLDTWVGRVGPLDPWWASEIVLGVGSALAAGHEIGVVLSNLTNLDVLIQADDAGVPTVRVLGFDPVPSSPDARQLPIESFLFLAPNSAQSIATPAVDVWTLGLIGFYAFSGRYFWRADSEVSSIAIVRQMFQEPLPSLATRAREYGVEALLPRGFDAWFSRCVHHDTSTRCQSAGEAMAAWQTDPDEEAMFVEMRRPGANPELRVIYADWLEARGEGPRAAWVRSRFERPSDV